MTSAIAAASYAGIPMTLRHKALSFTAVTGHEDPSSGLTVDWEAIARVGGTIADQLGVRLSQLRLIGPAAVPAARSPGC